MEKAFGLKFILNQDQNIKNRRPIYEKLEGLRFIKPNQKLILRVHRPKSIMIGDFKDDYVISVPRSVSPYKGRYFYKMSHNWESKYSAENSLDTLQGESPKNENGTRVTIPRIRANPNYTDQGSVDILNIKGTSEQFTLKKVKARQELNTPQIVNHFNGALTKVIISKRGRPYKIRNNSDS